MVAIGPFVVGEIPAPLEYQFLSNTGIALDITGFIAKFQWAARSNTEDPFINGATEDATISDPLNGLVRYTWDGDEFLAPGRYVGMFWVGNNVVRYASVLITWTTCLSVDTPPVI